MRGHPFWTTAGCLAAAAAIVCHFWPDRDPHSAYAEPWDPTRPVSATSAVQLVAPGVTEPRSRAIQLTSELSGQLQSVYVETGEEVRQGQVLAELENSIQRLSVDMAQATLERMRAELQRLEQGDRPEERAMVRAGLDEAEANLRLAEFEAAHTAEMNAKEIVSEREVIGVQSTLALARARRDVAASRWELSCKGAREEDLAHARAAVREAQAKLETAQAVVEKTRIRSPLDGLVIGRHREPGEALPAGMTTPVLTVGDCSATRIRVDVDEMDVNKVAVGQPVYATSVAFGERRFAGRVVHVEPTLGRKNFRTQRPTERLDTRVQEVVVELEDARGLPMDLQMVVWFLPTDAERDAAQVAAAR